MTREIPLTQGKVAIVDDQDFDLVRPYIWQATTKDGKTYYARAIVEGKQVLMHRLLTGAAAEELVDHIDYDGLNNTRRNLRKCNFQQSLAHRRKLAPATSRYKGVRKSGNQWRAAIAPRGKDIELGRFQNESEAARAYDKAAREHYGEYAQPNFPD